jgi:pyruvate dehydrogenase complex dehydrogenase (E1) component
LAACGLGLLDDRARRVHNLLSDVDELAVWHIIELDGRSIPALQEAFREAAPTRGRPTAIIAHPVTGKGVSFIETSRSSLVLLPRRTRWQER